MSTVLSSGSGTAKNSTVVRSETQVRLGRAAIQTAFAISDELGATAATRLFTTPRRFARPAREQPLLADAQAGTALVALRSPRWHGKRVTVPVWRWGEGPAVLLVHGWEGRGTQLGALVAPLVAAGLSVVTFDAPGHGDAPGRRLYLTDHADCIAAVAAQTPDLHAIVAHSFGAAGVLLAHARAGVDAPRNVFVSPNALPETAVDGFARIAGLDDGQRAAFAERLAEEVGHTLGELDVDRLAPGRDAELLVIHDRDDQEVPARHGARVAAAWPGAIFEETRALGHRRILRDAAVLARITAFVSVGAARPADGITAALGAGWADAL